MKFFKKEYIYSLVHSDEFFHDNFFIFFYLTKNRTPTENCHFPQLLDFIPQFTEFGTKFKLYNFRILISP